MQALTTSVTQRAGSLLLSAVLAFPTFALAQDPTPPPASVSDAQSVPAPPPPATSGWKRVGGQSNQNSPDPSVQSSPAPNGIPMQAPPAPPPGDANGQPSGQANGYPTYNQTGYGQRNQGGYNQVPVPQGYPPQQPNYQQQSSQPVPASLTMPVGTFLTVRINQMLSSDKNQTGDAFSATLVRPLVINAVVVAEPGQFVGGHVTEAVKAGRIEGVARLGVQLTDLTLVDGQQVPIHSSLVNRSGPSSTGQDAGTIIGTSALGAAIGAAVGWGKGAAIGAGSGAALGLIGVLATRGHPSVLFPEQILTFRVEAPVTIATNQAPQAFRYVQPGEYERPMYDQQQQPYGSYTAAPYAGYPPVAAAPIAPYYYGYPSPYFYSGYGYGYPYYWGPSFSLFLGGGRYYGGGYRYYGGGIGRGGFGHVVGGGVHGGGRR